MSWRKLKGMHMTEQIRKKKIKSQKLFCLSFPFWKPGFEAGRDFYNSKKLSFQINPSGAWKNASSMHKLAKGRVLF